MLPVAPRAGKARQANCRELLTRSLPDWISLFGSAQLRSYGNCLDDLCISRTSTEVSGKEFANLVECRIRLPAEQVITRQDHSRCADSALRPAAIDECLLQDVQAWALGEAFDRDDLC